MLHSGPRGQGCALATTGTTRELGYPAPMGKLTAGGLLARNTAWNLGGRVAPVLVALFALPPLIAGLGAERFGFLTLAWLVIGYFNLFDLGLGRALTQSIAERLGQGREEEIPGLVRTTLLAMLLLGAAGAAVLASLSPWLVRTVIRVPTALRGEAGWALILLAASVPLVISTAGLRGILEAYQRFGPLNMINAVLGSFTYVGPLLVLPVSRSLIAIVGVLLFGRLAMLLAYLALCLGTLPGLRARAGRAPGLIGPLLRFGGWMTVTNTIGPLMVTFDRFVIGATVSMAAVAYYATPYEVATKLWIIPHALVGVLFPAFATSFAQGGQRAVVIFNQSIKVVYLALLPAVLAIILLGKEGLGLWLGDEFARQSTGPLQWLTVGVFLNSLATIPFVLIQAAGRPDLTAKFHMVELAIYAPLLWLLIGRYGIEGAAIAWATRTGIDAVFMMVLSQRYLADGNPSPRRLWFVAGVAFPALLIALRPAALEVRTLVLLFAVPVLAAVAWYWVLTEDERAALGGILIRKCRVGKASVSSDEAHWARGGYAKHVDHSVREGTADNGNDEVCEFELFA